MAEEVANVVLFGARLEKSASKLTPQVVKTQADDARAVARRRAPAEPSRLQSVAGSLILEYSHIDDDAHAVSIAADISERTGRIVRRANVYTTLQRLEDKGFLTTALGDPRPERGGKPRRVVTPTRDGVAAVRATMTAIHAMTHGVKI